MHSNTVTYKLETKKHRLVSHNSHPTLGTDPTNMLLLPTFDTTFIFPKDETYIKCIIMLETTGKKKEGD